LIEVVAATRQDEAGFRETALGQSLRRLGDPRIVARIAFSNHRPLGAVYNEALDRASEHDIVVFMHDDVWLEDYFFVERIASGLKQFDVIGVTGNTHRRAGQLAWSFVSDPRVADDAKYLSGRVAQGELPCGRILYFGPSPAQCELLDGVLLASRRSALDARKVRFDPAFAFHFYDMDFCRAATEAGMRLGTWPVCITHQSPGSFDSAQWRDAGARYLRKWEEL
jgi:GT2 family glycosyltransferase